jgi:hypothetical protein
MTRKATNTDREALAQQIAADLLAAINAPRQRRTLSQWSADKLADAGDGVAEVSAGVSAGIDNFKVSRESALMRQRQRTAERISRLVEQQLKLQGL